MIFFKKILRKNFEMDRFETDRSKAQRQSRYGPKKKKIFNFKKTKKNKFRKERFETFETYKFKAPAIHT
jgi:hypothetical protein